MRLYPHESFPDIGLVDNDHTEDLKKTDPVVPGVSAPGEARSESRLHNQGLLQ
ncbi:Uncharacterised protein [Mycobacteroides abscessus subsp. abscessus]|nr:Uncharacterised protein [Mycobacteroides abscessus subsp. abscessus]SHY08545.1 Uncharacterised protein [Mycobacteroides abscessus subsp. abscessus]SIC02124.1 Uncharacterised protein [Mycobacteroides abscessus subsp. abscessus]SIC59033.1 Uncharacterised protein [Mycobacteroides abscessus subsp. abscessus]SKW33145.1 Uncharacterised protein [Mycobacteroides abscessus subsp. abscessus]